MDYIEITGSNNISFVVLLYKAYGSARKCINSLLKLKAPNGWSINIIIVDNNSPDDSYIKICTEFKENSNVFLIHNEKNIGFAKGNNVGFLYAKTHLNSDFIILANSDTYVYDTNFVNKLISNYFDAHFDIAGPNILSLKDGKHQNPERRQYYSIIDVKKRLLKLDVLYCFSFLNLDIQLQRLFRKKNNDDGDDYSDRKLLMNNDYQLFGAFLIFSKSYIKKYDGLYPGTFMYGEENILRYIIQRDKLTMKYISKLTVYHEEGSSTDESYKAPLQNRRFRYKNSINSCKALLNLAKSDKKYRNSDK